MLLATAPERGGTIKRSGDRMNKRMLTVGAVVAGVVAAATVGSAASAGNDEIVAAPYVTATTMSSDKAVDVQPQAIPAIVAGATAAARGFTAAQAPRQVGEVARAASFITGLMGGPAYARTSNQETSIDVIFD